MQKDQLKKYLAANCFGKEHVMSAAQLGRELHMSKKGLRKQVNRLRQEGIPIASDRTGYFYAANAAELYDTVEGLKKFVAGVYRAIWGLEAAMRKFSEGGHV